MSETKKGDIKALFAGFKEAIQKFKGEEPVKFGSAPLPDGSGTLQWEGDAPMVGQPIMVVPADGSAPVPCPDGEYPLETGDTLKVAAGVIESVVPANAQPEGNAAANTDMSQNTNNPMATLPKEVTERIEKVSKFADEAEQRFAAIEENLKNVLQENGELKKENEGLKEKFSAFASQVTKTLEEYGDEPQDQKEVEQNFRNTNEKDDISTPEGLAAYRKKMGLIN